MNILNLLKGIRINNKSKKIDTSKLPSLGLFYPDDFEISITKCDKDYIEEYKSILDDTNITRILKSITRLVIDHTKYSEGYSYRNICSIDLFFIFLEIVKYTNNKEILIKHHDEEKDVYIDIEFSSENFYYFKPSKKIMNRYDKDKKIFDLNGYMVSIPTIGAEEDLTDFLNSIKSESVADKYSKYNYNFLYVLGGKTRLEIDEMENLIEIFNNDIVEEEKINLEKSIDDILPMQKYQLNYNGNPISIAAKLDLSTIFD